MAERSSKNIPFRSNLCAHSKFSPIYTYMCVCVCFRFSSIVIFKGLERETIIIDRINLKIYYQNDLFHLKCNKRYSLIVGRRTEENKIVKEKPPGKYNSVVRRGSRMNTTVIAIE